MARVVGRREKRSSTPAAAIGGFSHRKFGLKQRTPTLSEPFVDLRFPYDLGTGLLSELDRPAPPGVGERVALALGGLAKSETGFHVLLKSFVPVPDSAYIQAGLGTAWDTRFTAGVLSEAMRYHLGVFVVHSHSPSVAPSLSSTDERSFRTLLPAMSALEPNRAHGSLVFGSDWTVGGMVWLPGAPLDNTVRVRRVRWLRNPIVTRPQLPKRLPRSIRRFDRQISLLGQEGQSTLFQSTLGVIGLGGGGSHIALQAAHAGFGRLVLVDPDKIESSNLSRMVGTSEHDVGRKKVEFYSKLVSSINPETNVIPVPERFPSNRGIAALKDADVIISCLDTFHARREVQNFAWRFLIPFVDIGIGTGVGSGEGLGKVSAIDGHVHTYIPGGPCMWCVGLLTESRLEAERAGLGPEYVRGVVNPSQVISFNGFVASLALSQAMELLVGFLDRPPLGELLEYRAASNELFRRRSSRDPKCRVCLRELSGGDPVW